MTKMKKYITILLLAFAIVSCEDAFETTLEIDPPAYEKQLAISAFGSTLDSMLRIKVTTTAGLLEQDNGSNNEVDDAQINLYKDNEFITSVPYGHYLGFNYTLKNIVFEVGSEYKIEVNATGYPMATAFASLPKPSEILSIQFDIDGLSNDFDNDRSEIEVLFKDEPNKDNYYEAGAYIIENLFNQNIDIESVDPITLESFAYENIILDDQSFNGEKKELLLNMYRMKKEDVKDKLYLNWKDISRDHFLFSKTARIQNDSEDNPFSTPIQVYSNITNGVGIFSLVNERNLLVEVE